MRNSRIIRMILPILIIFIMINNFSIQNTNIPKNAIQNGISVNIQKSHQSFDPSSNESLVHSAGESIQKISPNLYGVNISRAEIVTPSKSNYKFLYNLISEDLNTQINKTFGKQLTRTVDNNTMNPNKDYILIGNWLENNWTHYLNQTSNIQKNVLKDFQTVMDKEGINLSTGVTANNIDSYCIAGINSSSGSHFLIIFGDKPRSDAFGTYWLINQIKINEESGYPNVILYNNTSPMKYRMYSTVGGTYGPSSGFEVYQNSSDDYYISGDDSISSIINGYKNNYPDFLTSIRNVLRFGGNSIILGGQFLFGPSIFI